MRYVYLIQSLEDSSYKIGISKNPNKRLEQLQTGNSSQLKLVDKYKSEYASQIEKSLQRRYSHLKKEGEWFYFSIGNEVTFIDECRKIEENILVLKKNNNRFI